MTIPRVAGLTALVLVAAALAFVLLGGGDGRQYRIIFQNAGQLVNGNGVQIGGRQIGKVDDIQLTDNNLAEVSVTISEPYAPLHEGTSAVVRLPSLSSVAARYISLTPGPQSAPALPEGAEIELDQTTSIVDLDQLFNTLDRRTRKGLRDLIHGSATQYAGKAAEVSQAARNFNPALSTTARLMGELTRDQRTLEAAIVSGARVTSAIAERSGDLTRLISALNTMMGAIGRENTGLAETLDEIPGALREANTTFVDLRGALDDLGVLVDASKPATRELARFLREFRPLIDAAVPTFTNLSRFVHQPGPDNDVTDITRQLPKLQRVGSPAFKHSVKAMRDGQPVVDFFRPYTPGLVGWLRSFGQATANYDANGHYARALPLFGAFKFARNDDGDPVIEPVSPDERFTELRGDHRRRCPGAASQARPDGSNPWQAPGGDCDPDDTLGGSG